MVSYRLTISRDERSKTSFESSRVFYPKFYIFIGLEKILSLLYIAEMCKNDDWQYGEMHIHSILQTRPRRLHLSLEMRLIAALNATETTKKRVRRDRYNWLARVSPRARPAKARCWMNGRYNLYWHLNSHRKSQPVSEKNADVKRSDGCLRCVPLNSSASFASALSSIITRTNGE